MLLGGIPFILDKKRYAITSGGSALGHSSSYVLCLQAPSLTGFFLFFKLSFLAFGGWLLDLGCYETSAALTTQSTLCVLWHALALQTRRLLVLAWGAKPLSGSIETLFRNAKWLEREAGEMHGWFFFNKRDRRTLFLMPVFFMTPLKKAFPLGGFFEILLCPLTAKLTFRHVSWLS